jgi:sugar phosphate isomerase/epimerase
MSTPSRRDVVRCGLAAAGAWAAGAAVPAALRAADAGAKKPGFHFGTVTYMVGAKMDLPTLIDACEKAGLAGVELRTTHKHGVEPSLDAAGRAKVKEAFAKTKVRLVALGSTCEFHDPKPEAVKKNIELTKEFVTLAADIGAWGVKVRPNGLPKGVPVEQTLKQIGEAVAECGAFAQTKGITIAVEMHGGGTSDPLAMAKIMEACKHPSVGLCWNSNGGDMKEKSIRASFDLCKAWIRHCHVRSLLVDDYPWKELFDLLAGIGYTGYTMLESDTKDDPVEFLKAQRAAWERLTG